MNDALTLKYLYPVRYIVPGKLAKTIYKKDHPFFYWLGILGDIFVILFAPLIGFLWGYWMPQQQDYASQFPMPHGEFSILNGIMALLPFAIGFFTLKATHTWYQQEYIVVRHRRSSSPLLLYKKDEPALYRLNLLAFMLIGLALFYLGLAFIGLF